MMKTQTFSCPEHARMPRIPYPNSATRKEILRKIVDLLLVAAMGAGAAACLLFWLALA